MLEKQDEEAACCASSVHLAGPRRSSAEWNRMLAPASAEIIHELRKTFGCGPFDGGCLVFAQALQAVIGGEIVPLVDREDYAIHAAVLRNGVLWDFDGPMEPTDFLSRYNSHVDDPQYECVGYREFRGYDLTEAMESDELARKLIDTLRRVVANDWQTGTGQVISAKRPRFDEVEFDDPSISENPFRGVHSGKPNL